MALDYPKSLPGMMKIIEIACNFVGLICVVTSYQTSRGDAFLAATIIGFIITTLLLIVFTFNVNEKLSLPWPMIEMVYCVIWSAFLIITSGLIIDLRSDAYLAGGIFGLFASVVYLIDAYDKFKRKD